MLTLLGAVSFASSLHPVTDIGEGWRLGTQAYSFKEFTFFEAVDKTASLGLGWIEMYPGQMLSPDKPDVKISEVLSKEDRDAIKAKLKDAGVTLVNYGVISPVNDEEKCRKIFEFAKDMGIETLTAEPKEDAFDLLEKLCGEYKIKVAIHNHPKRDNYKYWDPDYVLSVVKDRKWMGACADTGHWLRSGIDAVEALRKLEGHIVSMHIKDLGEFGNVKAHDVEWGTGKVKMDAVLTELRRQKFAGVMSIEYEYNWENSVPDIRKCVDYYNRAARAINPSGWKPVFANDLSNAVYRTGSWVFEDGVLSGTGKGGLWTVCEYGDFVLDVEFMSSKGGNSGVFVRTGDIVNWLHTGIEMQILDRPEGDFEPKWRCGGIFDCLAPAKNVEKAAGEWNHATITCKGSKIQVVLNDEQVVDMNLNKWTKAHLNPDGSKNKFNTAYKKMPRSGHIGLQYHGNPIKFRNIVIHEL